MIFIFLIYIWHKDKMMANMISAQWINILLNIPYFANVLHTAIPPRHNFWFFKNMFYGGVSGNVIVGKVQMSPAVVV